MRADPLLNSLVFGESVLNDAVAIVLFETISNLGQKPVDEQTMERALGEFLSISLGSTACGVAIALLLSLYLKHANYRAHAPNLEIGLTLAVAYISYTAAEVAGGSGILSMFFCGIVLGHYNWYACSLATY